MAKSFKTNLSNEVANFIRKKILVGNYEHDSHLSEAAIADELDVSRGPIREAIKQLEGEGFVHTPPNGRTRVISFTDADFADYQQMRFYIECDACMKLIDSLSVDSNPAWLATLQSLVDGIGDAEKHDNDARVNDCDFLFHDQLINSSGSNILLCMWKSLSGIRRSIMETNRSYQAHMRRSPTSVKKIHHNIVDCVTAGDREGICVALREHFRSGKQTFNVYRAGKGKAFVIEN